ncbi:hypothetical protein KVE43_03235 [Helicobacter pylori]|nr:hypothetical protein KVE43_03235 [Helicobacter pylori]
MRIFKSFKKVFIVKGIWDFKKVHNDFKTGQKDIFASVVPAAMLVGAAFLFYLGFLF